MNDSLNLALDDLMREAQNGAARYGSGLFSEQVIADEREVAKRGKDAHDHAVRGLKQSGYGLKTLGKALVNHSGGMNKYATVVGQLSDAGGSMLKGLGMFHVVSAVLVGVIGGTIAAVLKQNDTILDNYDKLADFGAAGSFNADELRNLALKSGYTVDKMSQLTSGIQKVNTSLLYLDSSAGAGMKQFIDLASTTQETRNQFQNLGYSQQELVEAQADYIKLQTLLGTRRTKTTVQLQSASLRYAEELTELAALTGKSRKDIAESKRKQLQDVAFNLAVQEANAKSGDVAGERMLDAVTYIHEISGSDSLTAGVREFMTTGLAVTEAGRSLQLVSGNAIALWVKQFKAGKLDVVDLAKNISDSYRDLHANAKQTIMISDDFRKAFNETPEVFEMLAKNIGKVPREELKARIEKAKKDAGAAQKARTAVQTAENSLALAFDTLIALISGPVNRAFAGTMNIFTSLINGISNNTFFSKFINPDIALELFTDANHAMSEYTKSTEKIADIEKKLAAPSRLGDTMRPIYQEELKRVKKRQSEALKYLNQPASATSTPQSPSLNSRIPRTNVEEFTPSSPQHTPLMGKSASIASDQLVKMIGTASSVDFSAKKELKPEDVFEFGNNTGSRKNFDQLDDELRTRITNLAKIYFDSTGKKLKVTSAFRTFEDQKRIAENPLAAGANQLVAKPGHSQHEKGMAIDIDSEQARLLDNSGLLGKAGLKRPYGENDAVHIQKAKRGGVFDGPMSGYPMEFHGLEAVVPLPSGHRIPVSIDASKQLMSAVNSIAESVKKQEDHAIAEDIVIQEVDNPSQEMLEILTNKLAAMLDMLKDNANMQADLARRMSA